MPDTSPREGRAVIAQGRAVLGIELGSTRVKACLVDGDDPSRVLAVGVCSWENRFADGIWTYPLDEVWSSLQAAYADLVADAVRRHGVAPTTYLAAGVSAMMHGYLAFDAEDRLLVPFRTWRNTTTGPAAAELRQLFGVNIPLRWSIAHLHQAILDAEPHVSRLAHLTTLAGLVHWRLTGEKVLGAGDAAGMFPLDAATADYDAGLLEKYDAQVADRLPGFAVRSVLPRVLVAGAPAGELTAEGARILDPTGALAPGVPFCPPEGDAGTGMVATCSVAPRTGNVSVGTSIFAVVVMERPLAHAYPEIDVVATPSGDPVAMVHCNNGASELAAWVGVFRDFAEATGNPVEADAAYSALLGAALTGEADAGGVVAYNLLAGEPVAGVDEGRPLVVRTPDGSLTLANLLRAELYGMFAALALGMRVLADEDVAVDRFFAHGGVFRTAGVGQRLLAAALGVPVSLAEAASEGGAWGIAVLAAYRVRSEAEAGLSLDDYLRARVFRGAASKTLSPQPDDQAGFARYLARYEAGLALERAAAEAFPLRSAK